MYGSTRYVKHGLCHSIFICRFRSLYFTECLHLIPNISYRYRYGSRICRRPGFCCILVLPVQSGRSRGTTRRRRATKVRQDQAFKGRQFTAEVILWAVRWYLMFPISYRDLELMLMDRGVEVDHTTIFRWIQAYAAELEKRIRPHLHMSNGSWRVDETYVKVKGRWIYLYRAVDSRGQTIDFLLSAKRDAEAAKRFFRKALAQPHTVNPRTITVDKNAADPKATAEMKKDSELWRRSRLRQVYYLNDIVERDHWNVKRLTRPGLGFVASGRPDEPCQATRRWQC
jgi:IS6 family transposase